MTKELMEYTNQEIEIEKPDIDVNQVLVGIEEADLKMSYQDVKLLIDFLEK